MPVAEKMKEIPGVYLTSFATWIMWFILRHPTGILSSDSDTFHMIHGEPRGRWKWAKNDRLWTTYPTFDGSSTFKSINWSSIGLVDPLNCFWTKLWVSYSSNNAIQNHLNCFIKHFHVSQVWFYPPITQSKFNFQNTKKSFKNHSKTIRKSFRKSFKNHSKIIRNDFTKSHEMIPTYNTIKSYFQN